MKTTETYSEIPEGSSGIQNEENQTLVSNVFSYISEKADLYLRKVSIDRNANTFCEFSEEYLENNGKITTWDNDDNGLPDCQYIRYPKQMEDSLLEETIYFDSDGKKILTLTVADGIPLKMKYGESEVMIYAGDHEYVYWIDLRGTADMEAAVMEYASLGIEQGRIDIVDFENERISVIKVGQNYYCRYIPSTQENLEDAE